MLFLRLWQDSQAALVLRSRQEFQTAAILGKASAGFPSSCCSCDGLGRIPEQLLFSFGLEQYPEVIAGVAGCNSIFNQLLFLLAGLCRIPQQLLFVLEPKQDSQTAAVLVKAYTSKCFG